MNICFPVQKDEGLESAVYSHFGSAPMFMVFDTVTENLSTINNQEQHYLQGAFNPMKTLDDQKIDAIVVGGIGGGALTGLKRMGIKVYRSQGTTIHENMTMVKNQTLPELIPPQCCGEQNQSVGPAH